MSKRIFKEVGKCKQKLVNNKRTPSLGNISKKKH